MCTSFQSMSVFVLRVLGTVGTSILYLITLRYPYHHVTGLKQTTLSQVCFFFLLKQKNKKMKKIEEQYKATSHNLNLFFSKGSYSTKRDITQGEIVAFSKMNMYFSDHKMHINMISDFGSFDPFCILELCPLIIAKRYVLFMQIIWNLFIQCYWP